MHRSTQETEMTRQQIYKALKQEKLFSRFCMVVASSFYLDDQPRTKKEQYLAMVMYGTLLNPKMINKIVRDWENNPYAPKLPKIQQ